MTIGLTHRQAAFGAVFADDADAAGLDDGADERVDVVVPDLAQQAHLLLRLAADLAPLRQPEVLDADQRAAVHGHVGEHLLVAVRSHARQARL